jgi:hypothetical protein
LTLPFALPRLLSLSDQSFIRVIDIVMAVENAWRGELADLEAASHNSATARR